MGVFFVMRYSFVFCFSLLTIAGNSVRCSLWLKTGVIISSLSGGNLFFFIFGIHHFLPDNFNFETFGNELMARLFLSPSIYLPTIYKILIVLTRDTVLTAHVSSRKFARVYPLPTVSNG